ncbi:MAG TPA: hypothetical protein VJR05_12875 [Acidimicrobiia bacterium]|nr:hypothetical protein [Acidimicrobiia bacterium]
MAVRLGDETCGFLPTDPYVGRFWLAIVGPSALTDLLRLSQAARREELVLRPIHLRPLLEVGLVKIDREGLVVRRRIPELPPPLVGRLPVHLRRQHAAWLNGLAVAEGA